VVETQALRVLTEVTNERQIVRSEVVGIDEIQTVTTHCDDVTNEIQRIVTNAIDIDGVQTLEITGTDVNEVQLIQTRTAKDLPEIQAIRIRAPRTYGVQIIGVIVQNIDTSSCTLNAGNCSIEANFTGDYRLQFAPMACGTDQTAVDSNWCKVALDDIGIGGYSCSSTSCMTDFIGFKDSNS